MSHKRAKQARKVLLASNEEDLIVKSFTEALDRSVHALKRDVLAGLKTPQQAQADYRVIEKSFKLDEINREVSFVEYTGGELKLHVFSLEHLL